MRILLAEDEKDLSDALCIILKHANYCVDAVYDGEDAYEYLMTGIYDAAILDIMMPKCDGLRVLKKIKKASIETPVLILTAKSEIDDKVLGLDSGADDYMTKPFSSKELLARLRTIIRRRSDAPDNTVRFGNAALDQGSFELRTDKGTEQLTNKEYQMLQMLMMNPGTIISVDRFMDKIWGYEAEAQTNVVWVYISYLRKKLISVGANFRISVVRNLGYRLQRDTEE